MQNPSLLQKHRRKGFCSDLPLWVPHPSAEEGKRIKQQTGAFGKGIDDLSNATIAAQGPPLHLHPPQLPGLSPPIPCSGHPSLALFSNHPFCSLSVSALCPGWVAGGSFCAAPLVPRGDAEQFELLLHVARYAADRDGSWKAQIPPQPARLSKEKCIALSSFMYRSLRSEEHQEEK